MSLHFQGYGCVYLSLMIEVYLFIYLFIYLPFTTYPSQMRIDGWIDWLSDVD